MFLRLWGQGRTLASSSGVCSSLTPFLEVITPFTILFQVFPWGYNPIYYPFSSVPLGLEPQKRFTSYLDPLLFFPNSQQRAFQKG